MLYRRKETHVKVITMNFPPERVSPRKQISVKIKREAEPYVYGSAFRGLLDERLINLETFLALIKSGDVNILSLSAQVKCEELLKKKTMGLYAEIAFNLHRRTRYRVAFEVAESYIHHSIEDAGSDELVYGLVDEDSGELVYHYILPDACLDRLCSVKNRCSGSKTIDVKSQGYQGNNEYVGLGITDSWWKNHAEDYDDFYVAVSECPSHIASSDGTYEVIYYAILGYATKEEVDTVTPNTSRWRYRNIRAYNLHPIDCLNPRDCQTSETVYDRMKKYGYV